MADETGATYRDLRRQWEGLGGKLLRIPPIFHKGAPDYLLGYPTRGFALCEIKAVDRPTEDIGLEAMQAEFLDNFGLCGPARVLIQCGGRLWGIFYSGALTTRRIWRFDEAHAVANFLTAEFIFDGGAGHQR